ncbi:alpha/beta hydrolase [Arcanobacterium pinnipediorum]|uniref:Alpha/beta fold hydrolase n=1 Tax=Arcanobacterium pinnipediorum TaxID=1503041 RepID=A0ABY5AHQ5_9ACTO|nr:alpha/beta fold hydrolase [Arcanobacterium pinnipediorum]USR79745.1 alpha/beta fold hydrolase [Arcanobacterium pinnipediorum]
MFTPLTHIASGKSVRGTIVAFHGVTDNAASLSDLADHWAPDWRVILVDSLGHGTSPRFSDSQLLDPFSALVKTAIESVQTAAAQSPQGKVVIYGHSLGGAIATHVSLQIPSLVTALILEDPALLTPQQYETYRAGGPLLAQRLELMSNDVGEAMIELMKTYTSWPVSEYGGWLQGKTQVDRKFVRTGIVGSQGRTILHHVSVPTLLVTGEGSDVLFGGQGLKEINSYGNPYLKTALISGTSHTVRRDNSTAFYALVDDFLLSLDDNSSPHPYLAPELQRCLSSAPSQTTWDVEQLRQAGEQLLTRADGGVGSKIRATIMKTGRGLPLRILHRTDQQPDQILIALHGGGYVAGKAEYDDERNYELLELLPTTVICAPEYRLAPEHPYPAAVQDCIDAINYMEDQYPNVPIFVLGDSAGAGVGLQALQTLVATRSNATISGFICLEPCLDPRASSRSYQIYREGPVWTAAAAQAAWEHYLAGVDPTQVHVSVRNSAASLPPTMIIANPVDPLRDEAITLATDLIDGGGIAELHILPGTFHGALSIPQTRTWRDVKTLITSFLSKNHAEQK